MPAKKRSQSDNFEEFAKRVNKIRQTDRDTRWVRTELKKWRATEHLRKLGDTIEQLRAACEAVTKARSADEMAQARELCQSALANASAPPQTP